MAAVEKKLYAALDMSGSMARFALGREDGSIICRTRKPMRQREAAKLADFLFESLECAKYGVDQIGYWSIGSGPGSFTGMRLAAALVAGLTRENGVQLRCVPTAVAIAASLDEMLPDEGEKVIVLFDGRNKEILTFELVVRNGQLEPIGKSCVLNKQQAEEWFPKHEGVCLVTQATDLEAVVNVASSNFDVKVVEHFDVAELILANYQPYDNNFSALEYIRPAVFTK